MVIVSLNFICNSIPYCRPYRRILHIC